jgi:hypothetical protein
MRLLFDASALAFRYRLSPLFAYRFRRNAVHFLTAASQRKISPIRVKAFLRDVHTAAPSPETDQERRVAPRSLLRINNYDVNHVLVQRSMKKTDRSPRCQREEQRRRP